MLQIIAATDFSPVSINAVNYAADMAMTLKAELIILNVYNIPVAYSDGTVMTIPVEELRDASEKKLEEIKDLVIRRTGGEIRISLKARMGNVVEELEDLAKSIQPFAVVIGTRGKTNFEKTVFGSSAFSIIKHLAWPVICIPPGREYGSGIKKVGFACDLRDIYETTPEATIKGFINEFKAELYILNVDHKAEYANSGQLVESLNLRYMFLNEKPHYHHIHEADIEKGIIDFAETNMLDMIITIPKRHPLIEKIFHPGNTRHLLSKSNVPIMCIHR